MHQFDAIAPLAHVMQLLMAFPALGPVLADVR
jgi:hypothetical protein